MKAGIYKKSYRFIHRKGTSEKDFIPMMSQKKHRAKLKKHNMSFVDLEVLNKVPQNFI